MFDLTHDAATRSWVESANDPATDFPIQNLPFGRFRHSEREPWRLGVAIGTEVLDLQHAGLLPGTDVLPLLGLSAAQRKALRLALWQGLCEDSAQQVAWKSALFSQRNVELGLPCAIGDYTDFYTGIHHATAVGKLFRPDSPLLPNYKWVPVGYHGRASSVGVSGQSFRRPMGQTLPGGDTAPQLRPTQRLDYELELAVWMAQGNEQGQPIAMAQAEDAIWGISLLNDWSARDVQAWEYQPLGPFLAKNFATTVSPWVVTLEALAPFRLPFSRSPSDPQPLPYLDTPGNREHGALDITLEVWLQTPAMRADQRHHLSRSNASDAYWTTAQLIAHHTVGGCNLRPGDLLGTGTLSGPRPDQGGSLLELSQGGKQPVVLDNGEVRTFLEDGDTIILTGFAQRSGARRIGLGECRATVLPAVTGS